MADSRLWPVTHCRSCQARAIWATTARSGKPILVDVEPVAGGNIELMRVDGRGPFAVILAGADRPSPLYVAHFTTCPHAAKWRRR